MVGGIRVLPAQHLDLLPLEDGDVPELRRIVVDAVLHHQEARPQHLEHEAEGGNRPRRSPHAQLALLAPDAEVDAGPLDRGGEPGQGARAEGQ